MKNWINENLRKIIIGAFVVPILLVAFVSISHVTTFYGISNPLTWAIYLSVGIEIAALSALAAVSVNMGRFVYLPFFIVTLIQMLGNIFFSFTYIDETGQTFQDWINMVGGLFENMGIEKTDLNTHKTVLSFLTGGLLPIISLTFAHMLVKFSENESKKEIEVKPEEDVKPEKEEEIKFTPDEEQIKTLETILKNYSGTTWVKPKEEPVIIEEEKLNKIEEILNNYNSYDEIIVEPKIEETISEIKETFEEIKTEEQTEITNDIVVEETQEQVETLPLIEEDKKKTFDDSETKKDDDYKVLSYYKRNG